MPELTWATALAWFGVLTGPASVAALIHGLVTSRQTARLQEGIHTATQLTLTDMRKGFSESQQTLGEAVKGLGQILERLDQRLERMDERSAHLDERWREVFDRMDQRADERHREVISAIQALKG